MKDPQKEQMRLAKEDEDQIVRQGEVLEGLLKHPGWVVLSAISEAQKQAQMREMLSHSSSRDIDQYRKGVIAGLELLLLTPVRTVEHRKEILEARRIDEASQKGTE